MSWIWQGRQLTTAEKDKTLSFTYDSEGVRTSKAVINIAREYKNGISRADANTLVGWADEYGLNFHYPTTHPGRSGMWSEVEHIKVFNLHIPVID